VNDPFPVVNHRPQFDAYSSAYDQALERGLAVSGEKKDYFARGRLAWSARCLSEMNAQPRTVLDFGCGIGSATPFIHELLRPAELHGVDVSPASLEVAKREHGSARTHFELLKTYQPDARFDFVYCNGVFHHIPLQDRADAVSCVFRSLRPGGILAFWENNPWNPGTRYIMSRIPFDRDAVTLPPPEARQLLTSGGFEVVHTNFLFIFPRMLRCLRFIEPSLARFPFGAQYQLLCRRP